MKPSKSQLFMNIAKEIAKLSKDPKTKHGALILGRDNEGGPWGYNDLPRGVENLPERFERPTKYSWMAHAERNAIAQAAKRGYATDGCKMFVTGIPCTSCASVIINAGIRELYLIEQDLNDPKWGEESKISLQMFREAGVLVTFVERLND